MRKSASLSKADHQEQSANLDPDDEILEEGVGSSASRSQKTSTRWMMASSTQFSLVTLGRKSVRSLTAIIGERAYTSRVLEF